MTEYLHSWQRLVFLTPWGCPYLLCHRHHAYLYHPHGLPCPCPYYPFHGPYPFRDPETCPAPLGPCHGPGRPSWCPGRWSQRDPRPPWSPGRGPWCPQTSPGSHQARLIPFPGQTHPGYQGYQGYPDPSCCGLGPYFQDLWDRRNKYWTLCTSHSLSTVTCFAPSIKNLRNETSLNKFSTEKERQIFLHHDMEDTKNKK